MSITAFQEEAIVATLDPDLLAEGVYCSHCMKLLHSASSIKPDDEKLSPVYCSSHCEEAARSQYQSVLFTLDMVVPPELEKGVGPTSEEARNKAQEALVEYIKSAKRSATLLVAKYVARQVTLETSKLAPSTPRNLVTIPTLTDEDSPEYSLSDHVERLRFVERTPPDEEKERELLCSVFGTALPGLEQSFTEENHKTLYSKFMYNSYGICYSGGRNDRVGIPFPYLRIHD